MKLIKQRDELQAQVTALKETIAAKDDIIQQIKQQVIFMFSCVKYSIILSRNHQICDEKENTRQRNTHEQMQGLIGVFNNMVQVNGIGIYTIIVL